MLLYLSFSRTCIPSQEAVRATSKDRQVNHLTTENDIGARICRDAKLDLPHTLENKLVSRGYVERSGL